jgi:hypothetical protein
MTSFILAVWKLDYKNKNILAENQEIHSRITDSQQKNIIINKNTIKKTFSLESYPLSPHKITILLIFL